MEDVIAAVREGISNTPIGKTFTINFSGRPTPIRVQIVFSGGWALDFVLPAGQPLEIVKGADGYLKEQFEPRLDSDSAHVRPRHAARSHARNRPTTAIPFGGARTSASKAEIAEAFALICAARASTSRASAAMARLVMANTDRRVAGRAGASGGLATGWLLRPRPHNVPRHIVAEVLTADRSSGFALDANAKGLTRTSVSAGHKVQIPGSAFNAPREISAGRPRAKLLVPISAEVHSPTVVFTIVAVNSVCYFRARKRTRIIGA